VQQYSRMEILAIFLLVVIIVIILCIIYMFRNKIMRRRYKKIYKKSGGLYDDNAISALKIINKIDKPNLEDYFNAGTIIGFNIMQGDFTENTNAISDVIYNYGTALNRILQNERVENPHDIDRQFMLNRIEDFEARIIETNIDIPELNVIDITLHEAKDKVKTEDIAERKTESILNTKKDSANKFIDKSIKYTSDTQNVHDSLLCQDLRESLHSLMKTCDITKTLDETLNEIREFVTNKYSEKANGNKINKIFATLDTINENNYIGTLNTYEGEIIKVIWDRTNQIGNAANSDKMKEALIDSMVDCWENEILVCINGRCARYISSISTLDFDNSVGQVGTKETYRNEILEKTRQLLEEAIKEAKESANDDMKKIGLSYEDPKISINEKVEKEFKENLRKKIDSMVDKYKSKMAGPMGEENLERIRMETHVAIE